MFEDIGIKDFALIDNAQLEFTKGFNILTGETGAGKSILIGALSFLLGGKGGAELIRAGTQEASVQGTIVLNQNQVEALDWLKERSIETENGRVFLRRLVRESGKTGAWIQNVQVTRADLADFTAHLVDIHGQHEHQSLMRVGEHRRFLDSFAGLTQETADFTALYTKLIEKRKKLTELQSSDSARREKINLLQFAAEEIEKAQLIPKEEEELTAEETRLSQYEKLYGDCETLFEILAGNSSDTNAVSLLKRARTFSNHIASVDSSMETIEKRVDTIFYELSDIADEIRSYIQKLIFDPKRLEHIQERLALIFKLKKKYADSVNAPLQSVIDYAQTAQKELEELINWDGNKEALQKEVQTLERTVLEKATVLSEKRKKAAAVMSQKIENILAQLGMKGTVFSVDLAVKQGSGENHVCGPYGIDNIEFLISANPGSPLKPLAKIASGGELSRLMLAIKTILADSDTASTLIFDEIDTGIGGEVSVAVGEHLKNLAKNKQVLCISHLASIAVYADTHIKLEKSVKDGKTTTLIKTINGQSRVLEIARMLSGGAAGTESLEHARALLQKFGGI